MHQQPSLAELSARRPVWEALSTLFLDTDVSVMRAYRVEILAASPYSLPARGRRLCTPAPACAARRMRSR